MNIQSTIGGQSVFVAGISGSIHNISAELRLDGANGFHKYIYVNKGSGRCMIDGVTQGFGTNTLLYVPDTCPHHIDLGVNTHAFAIAIPVDMNFSLPDQPMVLGLENAKDTTALVQLFDAALQEFNSGNQSTDIAIASYTGLITVHATRLLSEQEQREKRNAAERLMRRFAYMVEERFHSGKGLEHYAADLGVTSTHLTRVCQKMNNQSASQFIQDRIISEARRLLLISNTKIQDIATDLGFTSAAYFSRFFTTRLGMSPKEFRQSRDQFRSEMAQRVSQPALGIAI